MFCSWMPRNTVVISGVAISHLLILLGLLSVSYSGKEFANGQSLMVNLLGDVTKQSSPKKSISSPPLNPSSNKDSQNFKGGEGDSSLIGEEGSSRQALGNARQALHKPRPHYPLASRRLKEQGLVVVKLCVNDQGIVGESTVYKSSGFQNLDQSALKALSEWRFVPITPNSSNFTTQCFQTPVQFTLEG